MINVVLYAPEIPGNTGNIMRTCAGTGVNLHLIKPFGFSLSEKMIKRSGVNYIDKCNYYIYDDFDDFVSKNKGDYYFLTRSGKNNYCKYNYSNKEKDIYFIFGSESSGIPKKILKANIDKCIRIPINNNIRALNLANSVSVMVFEALRQQNFEHLLNSDPFKGEDYLEK